MLNHQLPRRPAFSSLRPQCQTLKEVNDSAASLIKSVMGPGTILQISEAGLSNDTHYIHRDHAGLCRFLKFVSDAELSRHLESDLMARHVNSRGVRSSFLLPEFPRQVADGRFILGYTFFDCRFARAAEDDIRSVGEVIGKMHDALLDLPSKNSMIERTQDRINMLDNRAALILRGGNYGPNSSMLRNLIRREFSKWRLITNSDRCQPTHGDMNYTNIVFTLDDSTPVVLDFEDTMISWFDPAVDVSMALERFVLSAPVDSETAFQLGLSLLQTYRTTRRIDAGIFTFPLVDYLRILSVRSLLTLAEMEHRGKVIENSEWWKFFSLYVSALRNVSLLNRLQMQYRENL